MAKKGAPDSLFKKGMKKKNLEQGGNFGNTVFIKKGDSLPVQFFVEPDEFVEFHEHQWDEGHKWYFVPCTGDECVLCEDENDDKARPRYAFLAQVYNIKEKKAMILKGGKDLGNRIMHRYDKAPNKFIKRVCDVTKFATNPVTHNVEVAEDKPVDLAKIKPIDYKQWIDDQLHAFYGKHIPKASELEDEDDDDDEDEDEDEDVDVDDDDGDEDDEDEDDDDEDEDDDDDDDEDEDDDDDEEDEDEPPAKPKSSPKKPAPKVKPGKKK